MPEIRSHEGFTVIGVAVVGDPHTTDFPGLWEHQFLPRKPELEPLSLDGAYYEVFNCLGQPNEVEIVAAMAVADDATPPPGLAKRRVAPAVYAVFDCTLATLGQTWAGVNDWLSQSEYEYDEDGKSDFEYYPPDTCGPDSPVEVWVPIRPQR